MEVGREQIKESVGNSYEKLDNSGVTIEGQQIFIGEGDYRTGGIGNPACQSHGRVYYRVLKNNHTYHVRDYADR